MNPSESRTPLVLLGAGNFAEEIADVASECDGVDVIGLIEGIDRDRCKSPRLGLPVHWIDDLANELDLDRCRAVCAVGSVRRKGFIAQAKRQGLRFTTLVHPSALVSTTAELGEGTIIGKRAIIAAGTGLGRHVIVNRGATVGHHVRIGDHTTISPAANIASSVTVGDCTYIGMGANVIDHKSVGACSVVGAGAVVIRDIPDRVLAVGVPARIAREGIEPL
jgi:acetyltransferase EpsM